MKKKYLLMLLSVLAFGLSAGERMIYVVRHCQAAGKGKDVIRPVGMCLQRNFPLHNRDHSLQLHIKAGVLAGILIL